MTRRRRQPFAVDLTSLGDFTRPAAHRRAARNLGFTTIATAIAALVAVVAFIVGKV